MFTSYLHINVFLFEENVSNTKYRSVLEWKIFMSIFIFQKHGDWPFIFEDGFNFVAVELLLAFVYVVERVLKLLFLMATTFLKNIKK